MKILLACLLTAAGAAAAVAAVKTETVEYQQGEVTLEGAWVHDDGFTGPRPGVLVVHQWKGLGSYEKKRAEMLARMGYNVLAVDIYGRGVRPQDNAAAGAEAGKYKSNRELWRTRVKAGLDVLQKNSLTDSKRIAAIGYCFGGTTVLELARSGADVVGVVSFHGALDSPSPEDGKKIKGKVLALHGADDPFVPAKDVAAFEDEMRQGGVDWQIVAYGGAVHSFTLWDAGHDNSKGAAYNAKADQRSWEAMKSFFAEIFR